MRVFITGGSGLIGKCLVAKLLARGDQPVVLSRRADQLRRRPEMRPVTVIQGDPVTTGAWESAVDGCDAVINLAGESLFAKRWNPEVKRSIRDSRVYSTEHVVSAIAQAKNPPKVLVQGSAIGYYGPHGGEDLTEASGPGSDFMAVVAREWEDAAATATSLGVRLATVRTGIVLAKNEGALGVMTPIFKMGGGAPIGSGGSMLKPGVGHQFMSWIHLDDIVGIFLLALDNPAATGPINGTAPHPVPNSDFGKALARALWRWCLPVGPPDLLLEMILGEVAQVVTKGQKVLPAKALELGYKFQYPDLGPALKDIFTRKVSHATPKPVRSAHAHAGGHH